MGQGIKVYRNSPGGGVLLEKLTADATATPANIDNGKTAYVNGAKITGTSTKVDTSGATATAANIESGYTAWANGALLTGSLAKGKQVKTGKASASSGDLSVTGLSFKPVGIVAVIGETSDSNIASAYAVHGAWYYNGDGGYSYSMPSSVSYDYYDSDIGATIGSNSIRLSPNGSAGFSSYYDYFYVVWGE